MGTFINPTDSFFRASLLTYDTHGDAVEDVVHRRAQMHNGELNAELAGTPDGKVFGCHGDLSGVVLIKVNIALF